MNMQNEWSLIVYWKNTVDGSTVNVDVHDGFPSRIAAEDFFINLPYNMKSEVMPVGFLDSPIHGKYTIDPYGFYTLYNVFPVK
jgi:hypothetical protein